MESEMEFMYSAAAAPTATHSTTITASTIRIAFLALPCFLRFLRTRTSSESASVDEEREERPWVDDERYEFPILGGLLIGVFNVLEVLGIEGVLDLFDEFAEYLFSELFACLAISYLDNLLCTLLIWIQINLARPTLQVRYF